MITFFYIISIKVAEKEILKHFFMIFKTNIFFQLQDSNVLKKEIDRWKEEVKIQEAKGSLNASKLKSEMEAHQVCIDY